MWLNLRKNRGITYLGDSDRMAKPGKAANAYTTSRSWFWGFKEKFSWPKFSKDREISYSSDSDRITGADTDTASQSWFWRTLAVIVAISVTVEAVFTVLIWAD